jgi:hypothetical protein
MHLSSGSVYSGRTAAEEQLFVVDNILSEDKLAALFKQFYSLHV